MDPYIVCIEKEIKSKGKKIHLKVRATDTQDYKDVGLIVGQNMYYIHPSEFTHVDLNMSGRGRLSEYDEYEIFFIENGFKIFKEGKLIEKVNKLSYPIKVKISGGKMLMRRLICTVK